ncbi:MAG: GDP-mannose 4,6-dehydratase, partial [Candidatus Levybacteria bacterium]|nr:GDP-mannose 4,6-dehydratase [Candidatus Levybacteria bacterium]
SNIPPEMWGGQVTREYLYIDDAIGAYVKLLQLDIATVGKNRVFNIGSGNIISVKDLIEKIIKISGVEMEINRIEDKREMEISSQYVAVKKAKKMLQWEAKTDIDNGLAKTIAWYKEFFYNKLTF